MSLVKDLERAIDRLQTASDALRETGLRDAVALAERVEELRSEAQALHEGLS